MNRTHSPTDLSKDSEEQGGFPGPNGTNYGNEFSSLN
jgi:hypothetical protein